MPLGGSSGMGLSKAGMVVSKSLRILAKLTAFPVLSNLQMKFLVA
jgi:hypothetical protein